MDVFYYWKDYAEDMEAGRIGYFRSSRQKLTELAARFPDNIWVFKTPRGHKGQMQLLARLRWSDKATGLFVKESGESLIFYDPNHADSLLFTDSGTDESINAITSWVRRHFPGAIKANFQGPQGQLALNDPIARELARLAAGFSSVPFPLKPKA